MAGSRRYETVLFDLDGTLIDTNELIIRSFLYALRDVRPDLQREEIIPQMGKPLTEQLQIISGQEDVTELQRQYREYNIAHHNEIVQIFPHVPEVLQSLQAAGIRIGVVTTKMRASTERSLKHFAVDSYIEYIVSIEEVSRPKPHPEPIEKALSYFGTDPRQTLMVGDSPFDLLAAQAAGVTAIGVAWSLKGAECLLQYPPVTVIHDMRELLQIVRTGQLV